MHEWVEKLLELQKTDTRIAKLKKQIQDVPGEKKNAEENLTTAEETLSNAKEEVQQAQKKIDNLESEIGKYKDKKKELQSKTTMIKDNKEYQAALDEIKSCDNKISELEDQELESMQELEQAKERRKKADKDYNAEENRANQRKQDLETREQNCKSEVERLKSERQKYVQEIPQRVLDRYERLAKLRMQPARTPKEVFAPIKEGDVCGACNMNIPAQLRMNAINGEMVSCSECGMLLYYDKD